MNEPGKLPPSVLRYCVKLTQKKYRGAEQKFLIEGFRLVGEALDSDWEIENVLITEPELPSKEGRRILQAARDRKIQVFMVTQTELRKLSDTVTAQGVLAVAAVKRFPVDQFWLRARRKWLIVALDGIADPGNLGTILRTCDWFGVDAVWLNRTSVELYGPKVVRSTMGSIFHLPILPDIDLISMLRLAKRNGSKVIVTSSTDGSSFPPSSYPDRSVLVFGNEARGVSAEIQREADDRLSIPKFGRAESLNVAVACGVIVGGLRLMRGR